MNASVSVGVFGLVNSRARKHLSCKSADIIPFSFLVALSSLLHFCQDLTLLPVLKIFLRGSVLSLTPSREVLLLWVFSEYF